METLFSLIMIAAPGVVGALFGAVFAVFSGGPTRRRVIRASLLGGGLCATGVVTLGGLLIGALGVAPYYLVASFAVVVALIIAYGIRRRRLSRVSPPA